MRLTRPTLSSTALVLLATAYILVLNNRTFWTLVFAYFPDHPLKIGGASLVIFLILLAFIFIFRVRFVLKPAVIILFLLSAVCSYYIDTFKIFIDRNMVENVFVTTPAEAQHLITRNFLLHIALYGGLPSLFVCLVRVSHQRFLQAAPRNLAAIFGSLAVAALILVTDFGSYSAFYRDYRIEILGTLNPIGAIRSTVQYVVRESRDRNLVAQPLGTDATQASWAKNGKKKLLTVVVVGETARAQNFSFFGYERDTNPELRQRQAIAFANTTSCGTETSVSVPCMFSPFTRDEYSSTKFKGSENLMDVLKHGGLQVEWLENNTGSKGVADRIPYVELQDSKNLDYCEKGECRDQILVDYLRDHMAELKDNAVIVIHTMGSHGPSYYLRYPRDRTQFKPECMTGEFSDCARETIINSYDNSILYTDHILSEIIDLLKANEDTVASSMLYMSDHGESLGEDGIYLHAMPYFIAPDYQTHIPFITWISDSFSTQTGLDSTCLRTSEKTAAFSHDNLFHTVLGMMGVETSAYQKSLDAFAPCRRPVADAQS